jgi:hypothetical protein
VMPFGKQSTRRESDALYICLILPSVDGFLTHFALRAVTRRW